MSGWQVSEFDLEFRIHGSTVFFVIVLFGSVTIVFILFLYIRYLCHHYDIPIPFRRNLAPPRPRGLNPNIIKALPVTLFHPSPDSNSTHDVDDESRAKPECSICLAEFEEGDQLKILPTCKHFFHSECVDKWLSTHSSCPLCRGLLSRSSLNRPAAAPAPAAPEPEVTIEIN